MYGWAMKPSVCSLAIKWVHVDVFAYLVSATLTTTYKYLALGLLYGNIVVNGIKLICMNQISLALCCGRLN